MRTTILAGAALALASIPAGPLLASEAGPYVSLSVGYLQLADQDGSAGGENFSNTFDAGYALHGAGGYRFNDWFRAELELGYARSGLDQIDGLLGQSFNIEGHVDVFTAALNAFAEWPVTAMLTPYVGGGIGLAHTDLHDVAVRIGGTKLKGDDDKSTDLLLQGEAGVAVAVAENWDLVPAYRYMWIDNGGSGLDDNTAHLFRVGLRYNF
ncbi:outer membrane protein [Marinimicrococcus flavescens]|uniref:Porin family protein n=1 Tax=Marinimicrococcus flavescens TaxID=3031815 RepID=A0AAP3XRR4_9PROT|nr:porin family protein [Marinimicrococcus flavescens]